MKHPSERPDAPGRTAAIAAAGAVSEASLSAAPWMLYSTRQSWTFLLILFLVSTSNYVDRYLVSVLFEPIKAEFGVSDTLLGLLSGIAFASCYATLGIPIARWADRGNRKLIITLALIVWSAMTAACGLAASFWHLAVARLGVGVGEAGAVPPAHSLIADYFEPKGRSRPLSVFTAAATVGNLIALSAGALIADVHGWRAAFLAMGLPGLALAVVVALWIKEPRNVLGYARGTAAQESFGTALRALRSKPTVVNVIISGTIYFMAFYGPFVFIPSYMIRVLNMDLAQVGWSYGLVSVCSAIVGLPLGGYLTDRLARKDIRWLGRLPAMCMLAALPVLELALLSSSTRLFLAALFIGEIGLAASVPGKYSLLHAVCGPRRRALAIAIFFFFANLLGLGLGPVLTGALSDAFTASLGPPGLRYALMIGIALLVPASYFMLRGARTVQQDLES